MCIELNTEIKLMVYHYTEYFLCHETSAAFHSVKHSKYM